MMLQRKTQPLQMSSIAAVASMSGAPVEISMSGTLNVGENSSSSCKFELMKLLPLSSLSLLLVQNTTPSASLSPASVLSEKKQDLITVINH